MPIAVTGVMGEFPLEPRSDAIVRPFDGNFAFIVAHRAFTRLSPPFHRQTQLVAVAAARRRWPWP
jgi:hypothetical protein